MENFYTIKDKSVNENNFTYHIELNANHPVYKGHFPQTPVAPGVMLTDTIRELTEDATDKSLELIEARNIKFLRPVLPKEEVNFIIELSVEEIEEGVKVKSVGKTTEHDYFKISANFQLS